MSGERTFARAVTGADAAVFVGLFVLATALGVGALIGLLVVDVVSGAAAFGYGLAGAVLLWVLGLELARRLRGWSWADLGFVAAARPGHVVWQVPLAYVAVILLTALIGSMLAEPAPPNEELAAGLALGPAAVAAVALALVLAGPFVEEVVFRRILLGAFERAGFVVALLGQAVLFGLLHMIPQVMLFAALLGIATGVLARVHRSLWPPFFLHALNNLVAFAATLALLMD